MEKSKAIGSHLKGLDTELNGTHIDIKRSTFTSETNVDWPLIQMSDNNIIDCCSRQFSNQFFFGSATRAPVYVCVCVFFVVVVRFAPFNSL